MWTFKGKYSGEARAYIKRKEKKVYTIFSLILSIFILIALIGIAIGLSDGDVTLISIIFGVGFGLIALENVALFIMYKHAPKCEIEIKNDGFHFYNGEMSVSFAFYKIGSVEYYDDFIVVAKNYVLQKELLVEGDWEELKALLKKVEESLDTEEPMYQIEEPETEFFEATVKGKRIYEKFVHRVSMHVAEGVFQFFVTFQLENDEEMEFEIGKEWYEKLEKGQTGTLVLVGGNFFTFGDGEEME